MQIIYEFPFIWPIKGVTYYAPDEWANMPREQLDKLKGLTAAAAVAQQKAELARQASNMAKAAADEVDELLKQIGETHRQ